MKKTSFLLTLTLVLVFGLSSVGLSADFKMPNARAGESRRYENYDRYKFENYSNRDTPYYDRRNDYNNRYDRRHDDYNNRYDRHNRHDNSRRYDRHDRPNIAGPQKRDSELRWSHSE